MNTAHLAEHDGADATTIATKVMAHIVITDDLRLLSTLLSQPIVNKTVLAMTPNIAPPLTASRILAPLAASTSIHTSRVPWRLHRGELTTEEQTESLDDARTVVDERCRTSARTGLSPDRTSSRALVPRKHITDTPRPGKCMRPLRRDDPCRRNRTEYLPTVHEITGTAIHKHRGKPHRPELLRTGLGSLLSSTARNRREAATRLVAGRPAAPELTDHCAQSTRSSRLILLRSFQRITDVVEPDATKNL